MRPASYRGVPTRFALLDLRKTALRTRRSHPHHSQNKWVHSWLSVAVDDPVPWMPVHSLFFLAKNGQSP